MGSAVRPEAAEIIKKKRSAVVSNAHLCMTLSDFLNEVLLFIHRFLCIFDQH
jgi:hypothetical protein